MFLPFSIINTCTDIDLPPILIEATFYAGLSSLYLSSVEKYATGQDNDGIYSMF